VWRALAPKARTFWPVFLVWLLLDILTKRWALAALWPPGVPHEVLGHWLRFTLGFNPGAAMGIHLGDWSRPVFTAIGILMLGVLAWLYRTTRPADRLRAAVLAFITAGAVGNLLDRIRDPRGVTDFIDVGTSTWRFWTFNVADIGITCGAIALAIMLELEARRRKTDPARASPLHCK
jgi:signal peptidase II